MSINHTIRLKCSECQEINYLSSRNKKNTPEKLELNKFCSRCRKSIKHTEIKYKK